MDVDEDQSRNPLRPRAPVGTNYDKSVLKMKKIDLQHEEKRLALTHKVASEKLAAASTAANRSLKQVGLGMSCPPP